MLTHMEKAQLTHRGSEYAVQHSLFVGGEDWSDRLLSATSSFTTDGGGSNLDFSVEGSLEDYVDAPVEFGLGYGADDVKPFFKGRLMLPTDHETLPQASGVAFGPFRLMVDASLRTTETYQGKNLEYIFMDLARRAEYPPGDFIVLGGRKFKQPAGEIFSMDSSLSDVARSVMEKAKFVAFDQPGGRRVVMPMPKPGSNGTLKAFFSPDNYKTLTISPLNEVTYYSVVVFRNDGESSGRVPVYSERVIDANVRFRPQRSRVFWVPDFPGSQSEAADEAARLAMALRDGEKSFSMTIPFMRGIGLYDGFRVVQVKELIGGGKREKTFICTVNGQMSLNYTPGTAEMTLEGTCYEIKNARMDIREEFSEFAVSHGVVVPSTEVIYLSDSLILTDDYTFVG